MLEGRRIVLGVSGGIAAYKAIEVCRRLVDAGAHVAPVLTAGATRFVGETTFSALASEPRPHVAVRRPRPDPAHPPRPVGRPRGRGARHGPGHRVVRGRHLERPAHGHPAGHPGARGGRAGHAHRDVGAPRRAGERRHAGAPRGARRGPRGGAPGRGRHRPRSAGRTRGDRRRGRGRARATRDLEGLHVLVTAGGTREPIDPVRFIGNRSSGKQGHALAAEAAARGARRSRW